MSVFQDQRQTDSIQALQAQLENVMQLVLSLSVSVSQLQREVSSLFSYEFCSEVTALYEEMNE